MKSKEYKFNNSSVSIMMGSILDSKADVIVSSADFILSMSGGLSHTILRAAGEEMWNDAIKKRPAKLGDVVVTTAGKLNFKFIFHAITIDMLKNLPKYDIEGNADIQEFILRQSIKKCFRLMSVLDLDSIAFPAIGTGGAHIGFAKAARIMAESITEMLCKTNRSISVELWLYDCYDRSCEWEYLSFYESFSALQYYNDRSTKGSRINDDDFADTDILNCDDLPKNDGHKVFISYSHKDLGEIKSILDMLNKKEIKYWIDIKGNYSGEDYKDNIYDAIDSTDIVLFISSTNSNKSDNVIKEISLADRLKKTIIPIRLDDAAYCRAISYDLANIDYIDYADRRADTLDKIENTVVARLSILSGSRENNK